MLEPTGQQIFACNAIQKWGGKSTRFRLGGDAGTGKTSLVPFIRGELFPSYGSVICTYTNKASSVLRSKGLEDATTIFRIMYDLEDEENMIWRKRNRIEADLVIVDEASMLGGRIREDLESYGVPILYIGDPFQLGPVGDDEVSIMENPDFHLTEPHRFSKDSQVIQIATAIREGRRYEDVDQYCLRDKDLLDYEAIICLSNAKRHQLNQRKRHALGFEGDPKVGERVMITTTDYDHGLFAGECGIIMETNGRRRYRIRFDGWQHDCKLFNAHFMQPGENPYSKEFKGRQCLDFGHVTTCHKAQGSQYDTVLVWEERRADARWRYTAATRAVTRVQMAGY